MCGDCGKHFAPQSKSGGEVVSWLVILLIVLLVLVLVGGVGFSRPVTARGRKFR